MPSENILCNKPCSWPRCTVLMKLLWLLLLWNYALQYVPALLSYKVKTALSDKIISSTFTLIFLIIYPCWNEFLYHFIPFIFWTGFFVIICFSGTFEAPKWEKRIRRIEHELKWRKRETNKWAMTAKITFGRKKSAQAEEWMDTEEEIMTREKEKTQ